jgi:hypothetical protein
MAPTVKQHLAAIGMCFDWLTTGGIIEFNPAAPVRGPKLEDYYTEGRRAWFRLHEKGGKRHEVPGHRMTVAMRSSVSVSRPLWAGPDGLRSDVSCSW